MQKQEIVASVQQTIPTKTQQRRWEPRQAEANAG